MDLKEEFEFAAEWRRTVAAEHLDDRRNLNAAQCLDKLAQTVGAINPAVLEAFEELFDGDDVAFRDGETYQEMLRQIGFHYWPDTAEDFCRDVISRQTGGR